MIFHIRNLISYNLVNNETNPHDITNNKPPWFNHGYSYNTPDNVGLQFIQSNTPTIDKN
jgi:hypothetical protein